MVLSRKGWKNNLIIKKLNLTEMPLTDEGQIG
jgi:hypothetical protein